MPLLEDIKKQLLLFSFWRSVFAELLGTLFLVLFGCGSTVPGLLPNYTPTVPHFSLAFGFTLGALIWLLGDVSGAHLNPAVSLAFFISRQISLLSFILYTVAQFVGGLLGAAILAGLVPTNLRWTTSLGATTIHKDLMIGQAFGVEFLGTLLLILVILACSDNGKQLYGTAPIAVALTLTAIHLFAAPFTGSGVNPARSFGPAVVTGLWDGHWIYWLGPYLASPLAVLVYQNTLSSSPQFLFRQLLTPDKRGSSSTGVRETKKGDSTAENAEELKELEVKAT